MKPLLGIVFGILTLFWLSCTQFRFGQFEKKFWQEHQSIFSTTTDFEIITPDKLTQQLHFYDQHQKALLAFYPEQLNIKQRAQWLLIQNTLKDHSERLHALQKDPAIYNMGGVLKALLAKSSMPLDQRLVKIAAYLPKTRPYYAAAKTNLQTPTPERLALSIDKQLLTLRFMQTELMDSLTNATLGEPQRQDIVQQAAAAQIAVKDYLAFCRSLLFEYHDINKQHDNVILNN